MCLLMVVYVDRKMVSHSLIFFYVLGIFFLQNALDRGQELTEKYGPVVG